MPHMRKLYVRDILFKRQYISNYHDNSPRATQIDMCATPHSSGLSTDEQHVYGRRTTMVMVFRKVAGMAFTKKKKTREDRDAEFRRSRFHMERLRIVEEKKRAMEEQEPEMMPGPEPEQKLPLESDAEMPGDKEGLLDEDEMEDFTSEKPVSTPSFSPEEPEPELPSEESDFRPEPLDEEPPSFKLEEEELPPEELPEEPESELQQEEPEMPPEPSDFEDEPEETDEEFNNAIEKNITELKNSLIPEEIERKLNESFRESDEWWDQWNRDIDNLLNIEEG